MQSDTEWDEVWCMSPVWSQCLGCCHANIISVGLTVPKHVCSHERDVRARGPYLRGFFTIPPPVEHIVTRLEPLWYVHLINDLQLRQVADCVAGALAHAWLLRPEARRRLIVRVLARIRLLADGLEARSVPHPAPWA